MLEKVLVAYYNKFGEKPPHLICFGGKPYKDALINAIKRNKKLTYNELEKIAYKNGYYGDDKIVA